jgi:hypothetical protein
MALSDIFIFITFCLFGSAVTKIGSNINCFLSSLNASYCFIPQSKGISFLIKSDISPAILE